MDKIACNYFGNNHDKTILTLFMQITILTYILPLNQEAVLLTNYQ